MNPTLSTNTSLNLTDWIPSKSLDSDERSPLAIFIQAVTLAIIMLSSIFGNILILLAIYTNRHLREITSVFIANLACADLLLAIIGMPFTLTSSITYNWVFGNHLCRINGMCNGIFCFASVLTLAAVSVERYVAIIKPLKYCLIMTRKKVTIMIIYVWAQSIFCAILPIFGWSRYTYIRNESMCTGDWPNDVPYVLFLFALNFFSPLIIMTYCYYSIFKTANDHSRRIRNAFTSVGVLSETQLQGNENKIDQELENNDRKKEDTEQGKQNAPQNPIAQQNYVAPQNPIAQQNYVAPQNPIAQQNYVAPQNPIAQQNYVAPQNPIAQQNYVAPQNPITQQQTKKQKAEKKYKQDKKAAKTLFLVMGTFLFCWTPHVIGMTCLLFPSCDWPDEFFATTTWLAMMNSGCNPIIYGFLNRRFRQSFKKIIFCGKFQSAGVNDL